MNRHLSYTCAKSQFSFANNDSESNAGFHWYIASSFVDFENIQK